MFQRTKESKYFEYIINYIENESKVQDLDTLSGLGEPKINIDCTPFNGEWGRPQNDESSAKRYYDDKNNKFIQV